MFPNHGPYDRLGSLNMLICPYCQMRCDIRATVCPHCTRAIPPEYLAEYADPLGVLCQVLRPFFPPLGVAMFFLVGLLLDRTMEWEPDCLINRLLFPIGWLVYYTFLIYILPKFIADLFTMVLAVSDGGEPSEYRYFPFMVQYWVIVGMVLSYNYLAARSPNVAGIPGFYRLVAGITLCVLAWKWSWNKFLPGPNPIPKLLASLLFSPKPQPWRSRREREADNAPLD